MSSKIVGGPLSRHVIITRLMDTYVQSGIVQKWVYEAQARRYIVDMPNGNTLLYTLQQMEAFTQGVQGMAYRLCLSPLDPREPMGPQYSKDEIQQMLEEAYGDDDDDAGFVRAAPAAAVQPLPPPF